MKKVLFVLRIGDALCLWCLWYSPWRTRLRSISTSANVDNFYCVGAQNFALFFPSIFILSSLSWRSSRGILVVFLKRAGTIKCARLEFSGCRLTSSGGRQKKRRKNEKMKKLKQKKKGKNKQENKKEKKGKKKRRRRKGCLHSETAPKIDARSITKWTKECDKRLNRLISCIHHTCEYKQYCHVGNTAKQCRLGLFQDSDFAGDLEDSKSTSGATLCVFGSHTFVPISWMCKKQTAVSHSSTESEIISLDTGLKDIDAVPSNVQSASREALLYVFEDNEAVIKMIIKGRSPTMRHVSRTHRVALDWLFDRINLDSKIQIKYIDTKNQLTDILTKGNFTRDEWNHLLNLFNISHFSSTACTAAMVKRAQQDSGEERVTAKSRPMMNLTARMPSVVSSSTSSNPGRTSYGYQDPGKSVASDDRSGKPEKTSPPGYSKEDYGQSWSSQEWKSGAAEHDRSGKPEKTSWDLIQVAPHREEPLLGGNAHSVRYGDTIHDGSGKPETVNHQEEANSENFVMGSDEAEFVNKVKDQVRNRQKRMSNDAESGEEHSIIW